MNDHLELSSPVPPPGTSARPPVDGRTDLSENVIEIIAGLAAREVPGVHRLGRGRIKDALHRVTGTLETRRGVVVEVGRRAIAVDLEMIVDYGADLYEVAQRARELVRDRLEAMTGRVVTEVNIHVADVFYQTEAPRSRRVE